MGAGEGYRGKEKREQREVRVGGSFTAASNETSKEESISPALLNLVRPKGEDDKRQSNRRKEKKKKQTKKFSFQKKGTSKRCNLTNCQKPKASRPCTKGDKTRYSGLVLGFLEQMRDEDVCNNACRESVRVSVSLRKGVLVGLLPWDENISQRENCGCLVLQNPPSFSDTEALISSLSESTQL